MTSCPTIIVVAAGSPTPCTDLAPAPRVEEATALRKTLAQVDVTGLPWLLVTSCAQVLEDITDVPGGSVLLMPRKAPGNAAEAEIGVGALISAGVLARPQAPGWIVLPGNMPALQPSTLEQLAEQLASFSLVFAQHQGLRGYPVGFGPEFFSELISLQEHARGPQRILARYPGQGIEVDDAEVLSSGWGQSKPLSASSRRRVFEGLYTHQRE